MSPEPAAGPLQIALLAHIVGAAAGLAAGYVALCTRKGGATHRAVGSAFVVAMLVMTSTAALLEAVRGKSPATNFPASLLTAYLVVTGTTALRPPSRGSRWIDHGGTTVAVAVGFVSLVFGFEAILLGGERNGMPAFPFFLFGVVGLLGGIGDVRVARAGGLTGRARLARHLWRMCTALLFAALSFFLGQADEIPAALRHPVLLSVPIVIVPVTMFVWLWRLRRRRAHGDVVETA